jgi:hypothetical protein
MVPGPRCHRTHARTASNPIAGPSPAMMAPTANARQSPSLALAIVLSCWHSRLHFIKLMTAFLSEFAPSRIDAADVVRSLQTCDGSSALASRARARAKLQPTRKGGDRAENTSPSAGPGSRSRSRLLANAQAMIRAGCICRWAIRVAMRRISWIDQRIRGRDATAAGLWPDSFFGALRGSPGGG